jgi:hypothetical protein
MGGLLARYAIGVLYAEKFFDDIEPLNFTTFATPHLGTKKPRGTLVDRAFNFFAPLVIGRTGTCGSYMHCIPFVSEPFTSRISIFPPRRS